MTRAFRFTYKSCNAGASPGDVKDVGTTLRGFGARRAPSLDDGTADRLLSVNVAPADAPPGYEGVAAMIAAARPHTATTWIPGETRALHAFQSARAGAPILLPEERRAVMKAPRSKVLARVPAKAALAGALVLVGGTAAAAATGSLPGPIQSTVASALHVVGISVPSSSSANPHPSVNASPHASEGANNSLYGLCSAYTSHGPSSQAPVPARLSTAAATANETVTQFCNSVPSPSSVNPASSPSAHTSDEAGTVHQQSTGSGGQAGPGSAVTHSGTPGPPANHGPGSGQGQGSGQGLGSGQSQGQGQGSNNGKHTGQPSTVTSTTPTTVPPITTTTTKSNNGQGHSSSNTTNGDGNGKAIGNNGKH